MTEKKPKLKEPEPKEPEDRIEDRIDLILANIRENYLACDYKCEECEDTLICIQHMKRAIYDLVNTEERMYTLLNIIAQKLLDLDADTAAPIPDFFI